MDKTVKLEWHKLSNTRTRCLRITQVPALHCTGNTPCLGLTALEEQTARALINLVHLVKADADSERYGEASPSDDLLCSLLTSMLSLQSFGCGQCVHHAADCI